MSCSSFTEQISFDIIGEVISPFAEKFAIPRQSNLVPVQAEIRFVPPFNQSCAFDGLEDVSHIWLQFLFDGHNQAKRSNSLRVRPPRLGGNAKLGVFATRSSFRPNPLGLSLVKLLAIKHGQDQTVSLLVEGVDLVNGTKIVDIKPYLPYADIDNSAYNLMAEKPPGAIFQVIWAKGVALNKQDKVFKDQILVF